MLCMLLFSGFSLMQWKKKKDDPNAYGKPKTLIDSCSSNSDHVSFGCSVSGIIKELLYDILVVTEDIIDIIINNLVYCFVMFDIGNSRYNC